MPYVWQSSYMGRRYATGTQGRFRGDGTRMKALAIIVSFNHWLGASQDDAPFAREFVHALKDRNPNLDILLIDNASAAPYPADIGGRVRVLRLEERVGFGVALNKGLLLAGPYVYDWYICFNNDCWIDPNPNAPTQHG